MTPKLSVLIPMYNEEKIVSETAKTLSSFLGSKFPDEDYEVVFSDDGSLDRCGDIVKSLGLSNVIVTGYPDNRGKGSAIREGIMNCNGEAVLYTDCDLAYGCDAIWNEYQKLLESGADMVIGSRNLRADGYSGYTFLRKLMSKIYIKFIAVIAGFKYSDSQCGLKCFKKEAARKIFGECTVNGFAFDLEVLILAEIYKMKVFEFPVSIINHRQSESKVSPLKDAFRMIRDVMRIKKFHKNKK